MKDLAGKSAFVTGAAGGIGLAIARALAHEGVNVALADIRREAVDAAALEVAALGVKTVAIALDVTDRAAVYAAADTVEASFGKVHIVVNNAGVSHRTVPLHETPDSDFDWVFGVNVFGVTNGIKAFVPKLREHGEGGHIVNTASLSGFHVMPGWHSGLYSATKMGVVALSEGLREAMEPLGIGVSVLCPALVDTGIYKSLGVRPPHYGGPAEPKRDPDFEGWLKQGLAPDLVGKFTVRGIKENRLFLLPHPKSRAIVEARHQRIMRAFDWAATALADLEKPR